ncbi:MAG: hypothetical protein RIC55_31080 [Pirellulaceae bacterium]
MFKASSFSVPLLVVFAGCLLALPGVSLNFANRATAAEGEDDPIFSGPQVGEKLAALKVRALLGDRAGKEFDLVEEAQGKPITLFFVHEVTRPSVGLTRLIMDYVAKRKDDGLAGGVVLLSDDATETENFVKRAQHAMPQGVPIVWAVDGQEGPGAFGLNRKVAVTVLVAKDNRVTANFALVQPSVQADAPKVAQAVVEVLGEKKAPTLEQLGARGYTMRPAAAKPDGGKPAAEQDPNLRSLLVPVINKNATAKQVAEAAGKVEAYCTEHAAARQQVGDIARRIIDAGKLENYGTAAAQEYLRKWAKEYQPAELKRKE